MEKPILHDSNNLMGDLMKRFLIALAALFAIAGTTYADKQAKDKATSKTAVDGIGEAAFVKEWGTGKGDAKPNKYIGETEKNLQKNDVKHATDKSVIINHEEQYSIKKGR